MPRRILFQVTTPLGYRIVLTRNRWREIVRFKHPAVADHQDNVRQCLQAPDVVRASAKDEEVHLYYCKLTNRCLCVVVAGDDPKQDRFVVTAYLTKRLKQGDEIWTK